MKIMPHIEAFERKHANATLFIGIAIGIGVGMYLFAWLVPSGMDMIALYSRERHGMWTKGTMVMDTNHMYMATATIGVTSEKQFLIDMIQHHEAAITMSKQVLALRPSAYVQTLAQNIIMTQYAEVIGMKKMLATMK